MTITGQATPSGSGDIENEHDTGGDGRQKSPSLALPRPVPDIPDDLPMPSLRALPVTEQDELSNLHWLAFCDIYPDRVKEETLSRDTLQLFASQLDKQAAAKRFFLASEKSSAPTPSATSSLSTTAKSSETTSNPSKDDYSALRLQPALSHKIGPFNHLPEVIESICDRTGPFPLSIFVRQYIEDIILNPDEIKINHKGMGRNRNGDLVKRPTIVSWGKYAGLDKSLQRYQWSEAVDNVLTLFRAKWGPTHELYLMWQSYFDTLRDSRYFNSEDSFPIILEYDEVKRRVWWSAAVPLTIEKGRVIEELQDACLRRNERLTAEMLARANASSSNTGPLRRPHNASRSAPFDSSRSHHQHHANSLDAARSQHQHRHSKGDPRPCILCSSTSHSFRECTSTTSLCYFNFNLRAIFIRAQNKQICIIFNLGREEAADTISKHTAGGQHLCSRCLGDHPGVKCPSHGS